MKTEISKTLLVAKAEFNSSVCEAIRQAATKFHEQTGVIPSTIKFEMQFDCIENNGELLYVLKYSGFDYNLDEVYRLGYV